VPRILISGASIAGPALAHQLAARGWEVTVVERADGLRVEGQNIDVRGAAREVLRRTGLEDAVRAAGTGELGTEFVDARGRALATFPAGRSDTDGATAEVEILRGELARILYERSRDRAEYVFGDRIERIDDHGDGVTVGFDRGPDRTFDLVVVAEGLRSRTRDLAFPDGVDVAHLGIYIAYLTVARTGSDTGWWRWFNAPRGRTVSLRPDNVGTTRAMLTFLSDVRGLADLDPADQAHILRRTFDDVGWETPRVLAALDDGAFYFDAVAQVRTRRPDPARGRFGYSRGRVALVGDAAWCPSPVSGMGTSLALVGAYVLAGELAADPDHGRAFARYEAVMRPYVTRAQELPPGTPRLAHPRTRGGIVAFHAALRIAARLSWLGDRLVSPPADEIALPEYA
jgi:2-polyprenyl-6-methoxyphenol hydroxylase-like FAD-dependent oxidoreductase